MGPYPDLYIIHTIIVAIAVSHHMIAAKHNGCNASCIYPVTARVPCPFLWLGL